jgi:hypothetical protein
MRSASLPWIWGREQSSARRAKGQIPETEQTKLSIKARTAERTVQIMSFNKALHRNKARRTAPEHCRSSSVGFCG